MERVTCSVKGEFATISYSLESYISERLRCLSIQLEIIFHNSYRTLADGGRYGTDANKAQRFFLSLIRGTYIHSRNRAALEFSYTF